ncbi:MAG: Hpt domain-containing protein [Thermodesulfobacteriota bacterium]
MVKDPAILNHGALMARIDNDRQLYQVVLEMFLEKTPQTLVELELAIEQKDGENIHFLAHKLKGTTANLGAEILKDSMLTLEQFGKNNNHSKTGAVLKDIKTGYADLEKEINNALTDLDKDN